MEILIIGLVGYFTAWIGFFLGSVSTVVMKKSGSRFLGSMMGFTAGLLIAFICFEMLPGALVNLGLYTGITVLLLGVILSAWLEGHTNSLTHWHKAGMLLIIGISVHNIPEGMALGSMLRASTAAGISLAVMIAIHSFPAALAIALPLRQAGTKISKLVLFSFALALPMGVGASVGALFSGISSIFMDACVSFSGGVMLYITCGEILPESKEIWRGRMPALGAMVGFAVGVWLTYRL
ncbi:MAG: ZIP family metal transporter [Clostridiales bacterium]|nr:ZIP family metal transporter [Clostridiales bacterium]